MTLIGLEGQPLVASKVEATLGPQRLPAPSDLGRWQEECRQLFGQPNEHIAWAHLDWYDDQGVNRLVVFQMVPLAKASAIVLDELTGPEPAWRGDGTAKGATVTRLAWRLFHQYRAVPMMFWVIEGERGGHQRRFSEMQQKLLSLTGLPTHPPVPGSQPYAPWDQRVIHALTQLDRVRAWDKMLDFADQRPEDLDLEMQAAAVAVKTAYLDWLTQQVDAAFDSVDTLMSPVVTSDLLSREARPMDPDAARATLLTET